jgi:SAM-dependent MidA family methyltransferase
MESIKRTENSLERVLPIPDVHAQEHSACVTAYVREHIRKSGGVLPFDLYMDIVLYAQGLGYYVTGAQKFGQSGDFVTAPELGSLFSKCLARQAAEVLQRLGQGGILEVGPGTGALAGALLDELALLNALPDQYALLETSPDLKRRQQERLTSQLGEGIERCCWLDDLPRDWTGLVLVNEVLDALPVTCFQVYSGHPMLAGIQNSDSGFSLSWFESEEIAAEIEIIEKYQLPDGYTSERCSRADAWVSEVGTRLRCGLLLVIDYGYTAQEYYHPERSTGTLMCHYRNRAHSDLFWYPGLQDITAHVNFSSLAAAGREVGLELAGFSSQEAFLLSLGLTELAETTHDVRSQAEVSREIQQLATPSGMGERFKVLALSKGLEGALLGFELRDRSGDL